MSLPDLTDPNRGVVVQKPKADVYTWMLLVALVAILLAITCLALELKTYDWDIKANGARAASLERTLPALADTTLDGRELV